MRFTVGSIEANVLGPLRSHAGTTRLYGHFHLPPSIDNPRSGEVALPADPRESSLLKLDACQLDPQEDSLIAGAFDAARLYPDILSDGYRSARNLCFQLRSLARLWDMMADDVAASAASGESWVVFLRPDLRYLDPFSWRALLARMRDEPADLAVPAWHAWGGLNDRFAVATPRAAAVYARRGAALGAAMQDRGGLHGESLLAHAVSNAHLRVVPLAVRALRIRANGLPEPRDVTEFQA